MVKKMSDPMTNTDVEDVLASIRRLVSDNGRPGSATVQQPPSDRLVLTPSLRVPEEENADETTHDNEAEYEEAAFADDAEDEDTLSAFAETAFRSGRSSPDRIDVRQNGFVPADESAVVAKLSANLTATDASDLQESVEKTEPRDPMVLSYAIEEDADGVAPDAEETMRAEEPSETPIVPEDWASELDDPITSDVAADVEEANAANEPLVAEATDEEGFAGETFEATEAEPDGSDLAPDATEPAEQTLSEKIAALETLVGARRDQFEPDDPGTDAYAGTEPPAMEWEDVEPEVNLAEQADPEPTEEVHADARLDEQATADVQEDVVAEQARPEPEVTEAAEVEDQQEDEAEVAPTEATAAPQDDTADAARAALFGSDDDVLDEEALRELISDIVREELQGALGERITRNVRKLVRREIHRALAAQDLE